MGALLLALVPLISGITQPLKDWWSFKQKEAEASNDLKLATLKAQSEQAIAQAQSDATSMQSRLASTSQNFKQTTFWLLCIPILFTMIFPKRATEMWGNFKLIPDYFQWLFLSVYSAIWGLPIVKGGYGAIVDLLGSRQEYKIDKIKALNESKVFESLRKSIFTKGLTQQQVEAVKEALKLGEE